MPSTLALEVKVGLPLLSNHSPPFCAELMNAKCAFSVYEPPAMAEAVLAAGGELLGVGGQVLPRGGGVDAGVLEHLLVVVQAVGEAVERDARDGLAGGATGGQRDLAELVGAADRLHLRVTELLEGAGGLERGRPGVADVDDVRALARGDGGLDLRLQVVPADDLEVDLDPGLLGELLEDGGQDLLVVLQGGALVRRPVGERLGVAGRTGASGGAGCEAGHGECRGRGDGQCADGSAHDSLLSRR